MNLTPLAIPHINAIVPFIKLQFSDLKELINTHAPQSLAVAHGAQIYIQHPSSHETPYQSNSTNAYWGSLIGQAFCQELETKILIRLCLCH